MPNWERKRPPRKLPPEWHRQRQRILRDNDYRCCVTGCTTRATHVDHIIPRALDGRDDDSNLRPICAEHHATKSAREGVDARVAGMKRAEEASLRPSQRPPTGLPKRPLPY